MEKVSRALNGALLVLLTLLLAAAVGLGTVGNLSHRSYAAALAAALLVLALWLRLGGKLPLGRPVQRLGPGRAGALLAAVCLLLHLAGVLLLPLEPAGDYRTFWLTAVDLARGQSLQLGEYVALFPHILGYSAFLSLFLRLFGVSLWVPALLNTALTTVSGVLIYSLCLRLKDEDAAVFAFLLWILCPSKLLYNSMVLSEPFSTCLLLLFLWLLERLDRGFARRSLSAAAALGAGLLAALLLAAVNAARPIALIPIIAFFLWLLLLRGKEEADRVLWRRWLCFAAALLLGYGLLARAWTAWEAKVLGEAPPALPGYSIYVGFNPDTLGAYADEDMDRLFQLRYGQEGGSAAQAQAQMLREAEARIRSGQVDFARLFPAKLRSFLGNDEGGAYYLQQGYPGLYAPLALLCNVFYYALVPLSLLGALRLHTARRPGIAPNFCLYVIGLTLAHMLVEVAGRYHYSILPMLILLAAFSRRGEPNRR